jgi:predicted metal-dependent hydrolase
MSLKGYLYYHTIVTAAAMLDISIEDAVDLITVQYDNRATTIAATCWPNQYRIKYYYQWVQANQDNLRVVDDIIIHECAHLVTGPAHDKAFYKQCRKYGAMYEDQPFSRIPYMINLPECVAWTS